MLRDEKVSVAHLAVDLVKSWKYSSARTRPGGGGGGGGTPLILLRG